MVKFQKKIALYFFTSREGWGGARPKSGKFYFIFLTLSLYLPNSVSLYKPLCIHIFTMSHVVFGRKSLGQFGHRRLSTYSSQPKLMGRVLLTTRWIKSRTLITPLTVMPHSHAVFGRKSFRLRIFANSSLQHDTPFTMTSKYKF